MGFDPNHTFVQVENWGAFSCQFRLRGPSAETELSSTKDVGASASWSYQELYNYGFKDGESCWASVDVAGGSTNHESGDNFTMDGSNHLYQVHGTTLDPSFSLKY